MTVTHHYDERGNEWYPCFAEELRTNFDADVHAYEQQWVHTGRWDEPHAPAVDAADALSGHSAQTGQDGGPETATGPRGDWDAKPPKVGCPLQILMFAIAFAVGVGIGVAVTKVIEAMS